MEYTYTSQYVLPDAGENISVADLLYDNDIFTHTGIYIYRWNRQTYYYSENIIRRPADENPHKQMSKRAIYYPLDRSVTL